MNDLFGREGGRSARSRSISKDLGSQCAESLVIGFGSSKVTLGSGSASAPTTDGFGRGGQLLSNLLVGQASGSGQNDLDAADKGLGRAVLAKQALKECPLPGRESKSERLWARHGFGFSTL